MLEMFVPHCINEGPAYLQKKYIKKFSIIALVVVMESCFEADKKMNPKGKRSLL